MSIDIQWWGTFKTAERTSSASIPGDLLLLQLLLLLSLATTLLVMLTMLLLLFAS